jgi:uncharacterized protein (UPF0548 family)
MALWRFGRGWSETAMRNYLAELAHRPVNFDARPEDMVPAHGWTIDGSEDEIGTEPEGPPVIDGPFARARQAIINYDFSDPSIVTGHFDPNAPVVGRNMLLELKVLGFRFLCGVRVHGLRDDLERGTSVFGFRYDTLEGHIERGYEWFLLTKDHATGGIHFKIEAHWRQGDFPSLWSRVGFRLIGEHYRRLWRRRAPDRLRRLIRQSSPAPIAAEGRLAHRGHAEPRRTDAGQSR